MANIMGGTPPYTYQWSNGSNAPLISGLAAGTYTLTVTDANGCTLTLSGMINPASDITVNVVGTDITCFGENDGTASANAFGGTAPYTYQWSNGASGPNISNLGPGTYTVTATDADGCTGEESVTITEPDELTIQVSGTDITCFGFNDGTASVQINGGTLPYTIQWNNGAGTPTISNLGPGMYVVIVTDANGCTAMGSVMVSAATTVNRTNQRNRCFLCSSYEWICYCHC